MEDQASSQVVKRNSGRLECEWEFESFYEASLVNPGGVASPCYVDMHLCQLNYWCRVMGAESWCGSLGDVAGGLVGGMARLNYPELP